MEGAGEIGGVLEGWGAFDELDLAWSVTALSRAGLLPDELASELPWPLKSPPSFKARLREGACADGISVPKFSESKPL